MKRLQLALFWLCIPFLVMASSISVLTNGTPLQLNTPPVEQNGRLLVPLRGIFEALGAVVKYDPVLQSVVATKGNTTITLKAGQREAAINGAPVELDVPASNINGRLMVPLRFVSQALGATVTWNAQAQAVSIQTPMENPPSSTTQTPYATPPAPQAPYQPPPQALSPSGAYGSFITQVSHNATGALHPGDFLNVTLKGISGGTATFDLDDIVKGIPMSEVSPGIYVGAYQIPKEAISSNAAVVAHLQKGNSVESQTAQLPVAIESPSSVIKKVNPPENSVVQENRPNIYVEFDTVKNQVNLNTLRFYLDNLDITQDSTFSETFAAYTPLDPLTPGTHAVRITGSSNGGPFEATWNFTVQGQNTQGQTSNPYAPTASPYVIRHPSITVSHNAATPLFEGQILTVTITGPSQGTAAFDIGSWRKGIPMYETSTSGTYVGNYTIERGDSFQNAQITGYLRLANGNVITALDPNPVSAGAAFVVTILRPKDGEEVSNNFTIEGATLSNVDVTLTIEATTPVIPGFYSIHEKPRVEKFHTDQDGRFSIQISTLALKGTQYVITAVARDSNGNEAPKATITVVQK